MQNKGLVKFFAILFALVSIYQLSFTFVANKVKSDAKSFAGNNPDKEIKYLDSIGKEKVFSLGFTDFTFNEVKDKQINKGLDLEGGINFILQISVKDVLKGERLIPHASRLKISKFKSDEIGVVYIILGIY